MKAKLVLGAFCGAFILLGLLAAADTAGEVRDGLAAAGWPTVEGEVVLSRRHQGRTRLRDFEYRYTVDGEDYASSRSAFVRVPYVDPLHAAYPAGSRVTVHYDPGEPARAVIEPGAPLLGILAEALVSVVMLGIGGVLVFYGFLRE